MPNTNALSNIYANYVDLDEDVKPWLQINPIVTANDPRLQLLIDTACQWVQNYLGRPVGPTTYDRRFNGWTGWNGAYIELPYYPVLEVQRVVEWWGISGPHYLTESLPENQIDGFQCEYQTGRLIRVFPGLVQKPWFPGSRNLEVTWTAGYNPIPATFKVPALEIIKEWWQATQQASSSAPTPAGMEAMDQMTDTYPGLPRRVRATFSSQSQVGMG